MLLNKVYRATLVVFDLGLQSTLHWVRRLFGIQAGAGDIYFINNLQFVVNNNHVVMINQFGRQNDFNLQVGMVTSLTVDVINLL